MATRQLRQQSAMEYLTTYGWAIIIIAIAVATLYSLGVFNSNFFSAKATAGSCQVSRPYGPNTLEYISLQGVCSGEEPQYVAQFNGAGSYISTSANFPTSNTESFTVSAWIYIAGPCEADGTFYCGVVDADNGAEGWGLMAGTTDADFWTDAGHDVEFAVPQKQWVNLLVTYAPSGTSSVVDAYIDGKEATVGSPPSITLPMPFTLQIGEARQSSDMTFNGFISNVQLYNTSLSANTALALYDEGIGGAPIELENLVGWWQLNGNADDYSGNGYNGNANSVKYSSGWYTGYTQP